MSARQRQFGPVVICLEVVDDITVEDVANFGWQIEEIRGLDILFTSQHLQAQDA
jgi:hypothetical protein